MGEASIRDVHLKFFLSSKNLQLVPFNYIKCIEKSKNWLN